jgi:hypothetical protein
MDTFFMTEPKMTASFSEQSPAVHSGRIMPLKKAPGLYVAFLSEWYR